MGIKQILLSVVAMCGIVGAGAKPATEVVAHRGYWKAEGSAQNSVASLKKAIEIGARGSECDVYITTDGVVVVHHDPTIDGKRIDESTYAALKDCKLSNGEAIPTLDELLAIARKQKHTKLIIEIKSHNTQEKEAAAVDAVLKLVKKNKMDKLVEYISFSQNVCERLIALSPKAKVAYLGSDLTPKQLSDKGYTGLDYHIGAMRAHEEWFDEAKQLGLEVNVWTVDDEPNMKWLIGKGVTYITTDEPVMLQKLLAEFAWLKGATFTFRMAWPGVSVRTRGRGRCSGLCLYGLSVMIGVSFIFLIISSLCD